MQTISPTVWVVDDDEDDQFIIQSAFDRASVNVLTLSDGDQLLTQLADSAELPRLVLLDINMIRQSGFETLKELRSVPDFANLPVVMLTTSSDETDRNRCLALGADAFLTKPQDYSQLTLLAEKLVQQWNLS